MNQIWFGADPIKRRLTRSPTSGRLLGGADRGRAFIFPRRARIPWRRIKVTSRCVVEFLDTVRVSCSDYAAVSSGIATSSGSVSSSAMECS
ncbi:hypothetical protein, partial [Herbiconiux moechotypicola]|uniref:hypothetical protein n=1 Tax=Herbiconiux moechotypicola TaxID=637393 RepID=UPI0031E4608A